MYIQPFLSFIDEDKKDDFIDEMGKFIDDNADVLERVIVDENPELWYQTIWIEVWYQFRIFCQ